MSNRKTSPLAPAVLLLSAGLAAAAFSQPGQAPPAEPAAEPKAETRPPRGGPLNRRVLDGKPTVLAFKAVKVEALVPFIVESTGKVVLPQPEVMSRTITVLNDEPIPRDRALDLVFLALQQAGVAVVETQDTISLRDINDMRKQDVPVVGSEVSLEKRTDLGTVIEKVFALNNSSAENVGAIVKESLPDYAKINIDKASNQIVVLGNIGLLQRIERLVKSLDRTSTGALATETFRLRFADADAVAQNIRDLFAADTRNTGGGNNNQNNPFAQIFGGGGRGGGQPGGGQGGQGGGRGGGGGNTGGGGSSQPSGGSDPAGFLSGALRVSANKQQNSLTVVAEQQVLDQIRKQIEEHWDKPLPEEAVIPKVYDLKNSDPVKVRDLLEGLFGRGGGTTGGNQAASQSSQGVGRLAGQFSFQAIPEAGRLVVVAKSPDNLAVIDRIIADLDQPQTAGLPQIIELKHASAEELAEQLNTLLAQDGTLASIRRSASGLSTSEASASPFASDATGTTENAGNAQATADSIAFWWQRSRPPTDRTAASNLIGTVRIVPVWRQNALMVLSPPEYRSAVLDMVALLDRPGRQVLISAVICEISSEDATALGLRWSSQNITPGNADNSISIGAGTENTKNNFLPGLFDTSTLSADANLNLILQALNEKTAVNIMSEPRIFTSDNQEASFFDGKDIPFVNDQTVNQVGQTTASFDYRAVGIQLRARPRITVTGDIDLQVNLQLASIAPGETVQGALVVDRRETTTHLIMKDGQTVVISGILRQEDNDIVRKIPLLGDIPLLGELFKSREKSVVDKELLVFITPRVVGSTEQLPDVMKPETQRLDELRKELERARDKEKS